MLKPKEITLTTYKFQSQYYVSGHYEFNIEVTYTDDSKNIIERRYNEIRLLYKTLLLKCPGCFIPKIPSQSIWFKFNYGNQEQLAERMEGIKDFLNHLIQHPILSKNKNVLYFFSKNYQRITNSNLSSNNNLSSINKGFDFDINKSGEVEVDDEDDLNIPGFNSLNSSNKNNEQNDSEDIEPLEEYILEVQNRNKGIMSKGKKIIGNMINYVWGNKNGSNTEQEGNENQENKDSSNNEVVTKKLSEEDFKFIKSKHSELNEDYEINDYQNKLSRLNEGLKNILDNFEKLKRVHETNTHALEKIVLINNEMEKENKDKAGKKEIKSNINKIKKYCTEQRGFLDKNLRDSTYRLQKYKTLLEGLIEIYFRKKDHINFLGKLHSEMSFLEKEYNDNENMMVKEKIDKLKMKLNHQIKFIAIMNKDLAYEVKKFKQNEEINVYIYIVSLYKNKFLRINNCIDILNNQETNEEFDEEKDIGDFDMIRDDEEENGKDSKIKEYISSSGDDF